MIVTVMLIDISDSPNVRNVSELLRIQLEFALYNNFNSFMDQTSLTKHLFNFYKKNNVFISLCLFHSEGVTTVDL